MLFIIYMLTVMLAVYLVNQGSSMRSMLFYYTHSIQYPVMPEDSFTHKCSIIDRCVIMPTMAGAIGGQDKAATSVR